MELATLGAIGCSLSFILQGERITNRTLRNFENTGFLAIDSVSSSDHYDKEIM